MESPTEVSYHESRAVLTIRSAVVKVISGTDEGKLCPVENCRIRIGSGLNNELVLVDPRVSRCHAELQIQDQGYLLLDLGSTNGTYYRGARVREVYLQPGAEFRLGQTILRLEQGGERVGLVEEKSGFGTIIGSSPAMQQLYGLLAAVAPTDSTVLIQGESGTGKEFAAEEVHRHSPRNHQPFNVVDCGSISPTLIESELFGHERGAFSGASSSREGIFEKSRGGTVFLDEIGELPLELQNRLLRVLDQRTIRRVGSNLQRKVDVRLVAATRRDLVEEVKQGTFRRDLYFRLAVVRVVMPSLRQRQEDIPMLARHFLWQAGCADPDAVLTPQVLDVLRSRAWPGNVRELRNIAERTVLLADGAASSDNSVIRLESAINNEASSAAPPSPAPSDAKCGGAEDPWLAGTLPAGTLERSFKDVREELLNQLEQIFFGHLYRKHGQNFSRIAQEAGIDRHLVRKLLDKHGIFKLGVDE